MKPVVMSITAKSVQKALRAIATPERAKTNAWFFKSGKGQYGEGDIFIGVTVPATRVVAKQFALLSFQEIEILLYSKYHEDRVAALMILVMQFERALKMGDKKLQKKVFDFYIKHRARVNNWDLVDGSAGYIVGAYLYENVLPRKILYTLVASKSLWDKRITIVTTSYFIRKGDFTDTLAIAELLSKDPHDLIHKAVGWMLREVGKKDEAVLREYLHGHLNGMARTTLRYAIERFSPEDRAWYLKQ